MARNNHNPEEPLSNNKNQTHKEMLKKLPVEKFTNYLDVPIYRAVNYFFEDMNQVDKYHQDTFKRARYGRYDNLTWEHTESLMANLEDCQASLIFASGMNALTTAVLALCSSGDHLIYNSNCYRNISRFCQEFLPRYGIETSGVSSLSDDCIQKITETINDNTKMMIIEIPSNPHTQLIDLTQLKQALSDHPDIIIMADSTFASPYNFKPSQYGVDLIIQSGTKYLSGNANIMAGCVSGSKELIEKIRAYRNMLGGIISPEDAYILAHGIYTLTPRMEYYNKTGLQVATYLENHSKVKRVYYTGLSSHPQYPLAEKVLRGHGGVVTFELDTTAEAVTKFIDSLTIPFISTHFGGPFTTIEQYGIFTLYHMSQSEKAEIGINDQLIRMCLGFEDIDMLLEDLEQNLHKI